MKNIGEKLRSAFYIVVFIIACFIIPALLFNGSVWFSVNVYPILIRYIITPSIVVLIATLLISIYKPTRLVCAYILMFLSYINNLILFCHSTVTAYSWGLVPMIIGIVLLGFGVTPIAIIYSLFNGLWSNLLTLIVLSALWFILPWIGLKLIESWGEYVEEKSIPEPRQSNTPKIDNNVQTNIDFNKIYASYFETVKDLIIGVDELLSTNSGKEYDNNDEYKWIITVEICLFYAYVYDCICSSKKYSIESREIIHKRLIHIANNNFSIKEKPTANRIHQSFEAIYKAKVKDYTEIFTNKNVKIGLSAEDILPYDVYDNLLRNDIGKLTLYLCDAIFFFPIYEQVHYLNFIKLMISRHGIEKMLKSWLPKYLVYYINDQLNELDW